MLYLVRQGESSFNHLKLFNGVTEDGLTLAGKEQAEKLGERLCDIHFDACFCSPSFRTCQTCEIIYTGKVTLDDRLTEIDCGEFEGTPETAESMALFMKAIQDGSKGTEKLSDFMKRMDSFCEMLLSSCKDKDVLVVTHSANARLIDYYWNQKPKDYDFRKYLIPCGGLLTYPL